MADRSRSSVILLIIGSLIAVLVVLAVVMALRPPTTFDPGTPHATVQGFYQAVDDDDEDLAKTYLTDELRDACEDRWWWFYDSDESLRVVITDDQIEGDTARLDVSITVSYGNGPFDGGSYDEEDTAVLERHDDVWLISEAVWPMDRYACEEGAHG